MKDIVTIGEVLIDLTQKGKDEQGIPQFSANPGGAPANLAVAASRLGADTAFIGKVGEDSFGEYLKSVLAENKVDVSGVSADAQIPTTLAVVSVDDKGERRFSFYRSPGADVNLTEEDIPSDLITDAKFLHFGSVSLTSEPCKSAVMYAVKAAKEKGVLISYDPNYRANLWSNEKTAVREMKAPLYLVDVLKISDEELPLLTETEDLDKGTLKLSEAGISLIFVTLGAKGAFYRYGDKTGFVEGVPCKVGDTNGSGDTFFGAALSKLSKCGIDDLSASELENIIAFANKAASITTSRHGAIPAMPSIDEMR